MFFPAFIRIICVLLAVIGLSMLLPVSAACVYGEYSLLPVFLIPLAVSLAAGIVALITVKKRQVVFSMRNAFAIVALCWICTCIYGALPFVLSGSVRNPVDAFFESVSGFTTTGATVLDNVECLPKSIILWRCQTHWLGGMGIVALTVAIFPLLGIGGFQLIKAETTGPEKEKVTSRIATTAKMLWIIYMVMTLIEITALKLAGMGMLDALCHAFSIAGTGGLSSRNDSVAAFHSPKIEEICTVFMFLGSVNYTVYCYAVTGRFSNIRNNTELKVQTGIYLSSVFIIAAVLFPMYRWSAFRYSAFESAAVMSTTGLSIADYTLWPPAAQFILFLLFFTGGASGSTSGGIKVIRWVILYKQVANEMRRMLHPHGIFSIRLNGRAGRKDVVFNATAFITLYIMLACIVTFCGCLANLDLLSSCTGSLAMLGNIGPAFGKFGPRYSYGSLPDCMKLLYSFAMLAGRLELYTMLIFFVPWYWKK
jgi:trk system potassium uptake protein TrkH